LVHGKHLIHPVSAHLRRVAHDRRVLHAVRVSREAACRATHRRFAGRSHLETSVSEAQEVIRGRRFGPSDLVLLDGKLFFSCFFDGCGLEYYGGDFTHVDCTFSGCRVFFGQAAWRTVQLMRDLGYTITSSAGQNPEAQSIQ
jgi:hypothetical protein